MLFKFYHDNERKYYILIPIRYYISFIKSILFKHVLNLVDDNQFTIVVITLILIKAF